MVMYLVHRRRLACMVVEANNEYEAEEAAIELGNWIDLNEEYEAEVADEEDIEAVKEAMER